MFVIIQRFNIQRIQPHIDVASALRRVFSRSGVITASTAKASPALPEFQKHCRGSKVNGRDFQQR